MIFCVYFWWLNTCLLIPQVNLQENVADISQIAFKWLVKDATTLYKAQQSGDMIVLIKQPGESVLIDCTNMKHIGSNLPSVTSNTRELSFIRFIDDDINNTTSSLKRVYGTSLQLNNVSFKNSKIYFCSQNNLQYHLIIAQPILKSCDFLLRFSTPFPCDDSQITTDPDMYCKIRQPRMSRNHCIIKLDSICFESNWMVKLSTYSYSIFSSFSIYNCNIIDSNCYATEKQCRGTLETTLLKNLVVTTKQLHIKIANLSSLQVTVAPQQMHCQQTEFIYLDSNQSLSCLHCLHGYYKTNFICKECEPGTYNNKLGASECQPCPPGMFTNESGSIYCQPCVPGTNTFEYGSVECVPFGNNEFLLDDHANAASLSSKTHSMFHSLINFNFQDLKMWHLFVILAIVVVVCLGIAAVAGFVYHRHRQTYRNDYNVNSPSQFHTGSGSSTSSVPVSTSYSSTSMYTLNTSHSAGDSRPRQMEQRIFTIPSPVLQSEPKILTKSKSGIESEQTILTTPSSTTGQSGLRISANSALKSQETEQTSFANFSSKVSEAEQNSHSNYTTNGPSKFEVGPEILPSNASSVRQRRVEFIPTLSVPVHQTRPEILSNDSSSVLKSRSDIVSNYSSSALPNVSEPLTNSVSSLPQSELDITADASSSQLQTESGIVSISSSDTLHG